MKNLWSRWIMVWVMAILLFIWLPQGTLLNSTIASYVIEYACIVITLLCIYLALKMFSTQKIKNKIKDGGEAAFDFYSQVRIALLAIPLFLSLYVYNSTLNTIGGFCALITLIAMFFITPSRKEKEALTSKNEEEEQI